MSDPNWRMRPSNGCSYSATRPSRSLSPSNSTRSPALVSIAISLGTPASSSAARPRDRGPRREARLEQRLRAGAGSRRAPRASRSAGRRRARATPSAAHNASQCASSTAAIWIQPSCVSYKPVQRVDARLRLVEAGPRHRLAVDEQRVGGEHRAAVEQRRPELLALAGHALVVQRGEAADDREHRVRGVGHAEAEIVRRVALAHRALLRTRGRPTPGTAGRARRSARAGLRGRTPTCCSRRCRASPACSLRSRCRAAPRRRRSCCGARCRRARRAAARSRARARS